ncbi:MAG: hypothetical protein COZ08_11830 [Bacteroidetes bacterium CG_4_10_14_3_um_filter_42_6]|nr:MAG: hypothetical protein COZ08_11830 [Bacteroidetes bacterium CG_4_10_14_3_um_filter_42_6]
MKKNLLFLLAIPLGALLFAFQSPDQLINSSDQKLDVPENVQDIISTSCMPCHSDQACWLTRFRPKSKLNFDDLANLTKAKQVNRLLKIADEVKEGRMPKKSYLKKHTEAALSADNKATLINWAEKQADRLVGE